MRPELGKKTLRDAASAKRWLDIHNTQTPTKPHGVPPLWLRLRRAVLIRNPSSTPPLPLAMNPQSAFPNPQSLFAGIDLARKQDETTPPPPTHLIPVSRITRTDAYLQGCPV